MARSDGKFKVGGQMIELSQEEREGNGLLFASVVRLMTQLEWRPCREPNRKFSPGVGQLVLMQSPVNFAHRPACAFELLG
jgi:hypothetical protein